ncbi:MAG: hypothetical protein IJZ16_13425 [Clostridia bacterium]|nr:hypothetical protein [Clostridia bacterium]
MKKSVGKVLSVIMALCLFITIFPLSVSATDVEMTSVDSVAMIEFSPETELDASLGGTMNNFYSDGTVIDTSKYFYNQLTSNQKSLYDQIWAAGPVQTIDIDLTGISITGTGTSSGSKTNAANNAQQDVIMAVSALNEDNPLFCWSSGFSFSYSGSRKYSGGSYTYTITALTITMNINTDHFADFNDVQTKLQAVKEKYPTIPVYGISRHEKLKSIHDYLAANITYDSTISEPNIYDVYGALINGVCVCEGYSEAFKLLCDREGIPCITVVGTGNGGAHKWNMVQMDDGEWYTMDATWDDQTNYIYYSYFLIGSDTIAPFFSSTDADSAVHVATGKVFSSANIAFTYPTLSSDTYGVGILRYGATDVHFDTDRGVVMVGKDVSSYVIFITNNSTSGFSRTRNGSGTTTSTLTVSDGTTTKDYLVAMRGDVDASNSVNDTDYTVMSQVCATTYAIENGTAKFYAGDMDQDGAIDGFDAIALDLYSEGSLLYHYS